MKASSAPITDPQDVAYVTTAFRELGALAQLHGLTLDEVRKRIDERLLPNPTYALADGSFYVPAGYFMNSCPFEEFAHRLLRAGAMYHIAYDEAERSAAWDDFLSGGFGICLKDPNPETIASKDWHMRSIDRLLENPAPNDAGWRVALSSFVDGLDRLECRFTKFDRERFGVVSRDKYVEAVRATYPFLS